MPDPNTEASRFPREKKEMPGQFNRGQQSISCPPDGGGGRRDRDPWNSENCQTDGFPCPDNTANAWFLSFERQRLAAFFRLRLFADFAAISSTAVSIDMVAGSIDFGIETFLRFHCR